MNLINNFIDFYSLQRQAVSVPDAAGRLMEIYRNIKPVIQGKPGIFFSGYDLNSYLLKKIILKLSSAIKLKDKTFIIKIYDYVETNIDLEKVPDKLFEQYDQLIDQSNNILYQ